MENSGIRNGVYMGVTLILLNLLMYFVSASALLSYASIASYIVYIYFIYKANADERASQGGYMTFAEGLKVGFLAFVIGTLISTLFMYVLYNYIDPTLIDETKRITMEAIEKMSSLLSEDMYEEMEEQLEASLDDMNFNFSTLLMGYLWQLIFPGFIIAAITALIMKRSNDNNYA